MPQSSDRSSRPAQPIDVTRARYFEQVQQVLHFTPEELDLLAENGFLVTDRLAFEQFKRAYAYIYWKDLPVLITTDSILHAIHFHYNNLFTMAEEAIIRPLLLRVLYQARFELQQQASANQESRFVSIYEDMDFYLCVAYELLMYPYERNEQSLGIPISAQPFIDALTWLNMADHKARIQHNMQPSTETLDAFGLNGGDGRVIALSLFGGKQSLDVSQFKVRGHYVTSDNGTLDGYFMAMMWLALVNFPLLEYDRSGKPGINHGTLAAAHLLRDALDRAGQRQTIETVDRLLRAFVGWSDNITVDGLDALIRDAGVTQPSDYFTLDEDSLLRLLQETDYGQQRITGSPLEVTRKQTTVKKRPIIFSLMGQRFTLESWLMGELVFDRLVVDGRKVPRAYPSPLDVMAALGNDRAIDRLGDEFSHYGYEGRLQELRAQVASHSSEFWESTFYSRWLQAIRSLNDLRDPHVPVPMQSSAWADKMLHTQLASWTQLRHDNILYVKQPYTVRCICEYPAGYVEPYPAFYAAVKDYADFGIQVFESLGLERLDKVRSRIPQDEATTRDSIEKGALRLMQSSKWQDYEREKLSQIVSAMGAFFRRLSNAAAQLQALAQKELKGEPFTEDEQIFVKSLVVRQSAKRNEYSGVLEETWGGWYADLIERDKTPACVADVHTNLNHEIGEVGVLQIATGNPVIAVLVVESEEGSTIYVGPAFTYYEFHMTGYPLRRLTDEEWQQRLTLPQQGPDWTQSFRQRFDGQPESLKLPSRDE